MTTQRALNKTRLVYNLLEGDNKKGALKLCQTLLKEFPNVPIVKVPPRLCFPKKRSYCTLQDYGSR